MPATVDLADLIIPLADPTGDAGLVGYLTKGQYGKRLLQLRRCLDEITPASPSADPSRLLADIQRSSPEAFRAVLMDPDTAVLLSNRRSYPGAHGQVAASAAIRAARPATVTVPLTRGAVFLPGLGTALLAPPGDTAAGDTAAGDTAVVHVTEAGVTVTGGSARAVLPGDLTSGTRNWRPLRWISVGTAARLTVRFAVDGPLSEALCALPLLTPAAGAEAGWQRALADAWRILERERPAHATAIAAGLRAIIPLACSGDGSTSSTLAGAFGAVATSMPSEPEVLAVTLVHEFQHAKLDAALDLIDLYRADDTTVYYAPWRPDPRPLGGLLHGIYAHLGVTDFWNVHRQQADTGNGLLPHVEFTRWREDTWRACQELRDAPSLTPAGQKFAGLLLARLERLRAEPAPEQARRLARLLALDQSISWRLRNLEADRRLVRHLADAWRNGGTPGDAPTSPARQLDVPRTVTNERIRVLYRYLRGVKPEDMDDISEACRRYLHGDYGAALDAYETRVIADPGDFDAWAGCILAAVAGTAGCTAARCVLTDRPELVAETYQQAAAAGGELKRPRQLAEWLSAA